MAPTALRAAALPLLALGTASALRLDRVPERMWAAALTGPNPELASCRPYCDPHLERIGLVRVPVPAVEREQGLALVRVAASSVNPQDWEGQQHDSPSERYPKLFGMDFAGTVVKTNGPCQFSPGDRVWGLTAGTYAEYVTQPCRMMGLAPRNLNFTEVAVLPCVAISSVQALSLVSPSRDLSGKTVLVIGGAGGTGHLAVQLAKAMRAARVVATASSEHLEDCRSFGADQVMDYRTTNFWEVLGANSVDVVINCAYVRDWDDDRSAEHAYRVLRDGGAFVTMNPGEMGDERIRRSRPSVRAIMFGVLGTETYWFDLLRSYIEAGQLRPRLGGTFHLAELERALRTVQVRHPAGKLAIQIEGSGLPAA